MPIFNPVLGSGGTDPILEVECSGAMNFQRIILNGEELPYNGVTTKLTDISLMEIELPEYIVAVERYAEDTWRLSVRDQR